MVDPLSAACLAGLTQIIGAVTVTNMATGIVGNRADHALGALLGRFSKSIGHARNHDLQKGMATAYRKSLTHVAETISRQSRDAADRIIADTIMAITKRPVGSDDANAQSLIDAMDAILAPRRDATQAELMRDVGDMMIGWLEAESGETLPPHFRALFHGDASDGRPGWPTQLRYEVAEQIKTEPRFAAIFTAEMLSELAGTTMRIEAVVQAMQGGIAAVKEDAEALLQGQGETNTMLAELLAIAQKGGAFQAAAAEGISEKAVRAIVEDLGGLGVAKADLLEYIRQWIANVRDAMARHSNEGTAFEEARARSLALVREGRLAEAADPWMDLLAAEQAETQRRQGAILDEAMAADILALNLDGLTAKLRMAARLAGGEDAAARGSYLFDRAGDYYDRAQGRADNFALLCSIAANRLALEERTRKAVPLDWAGTQNNLGNALTRLGERESGTARLEEAIAAYHLALKERTRKAVPLDWAGTQNNLGHALQELGARESGTARLEEAVAAYRLALEELTREDLPLAWATTKDNLGNALTTLGERETGTARLEEAVIAYRLALEERTREDLPLDWAMTQNNLGNALAVLGEGETGTARLEEAVIAYRLALKEHKRETVPLYWATTQNNLGIALQALGKRETGTARLEKAVAAYRLALEERKREDVPFGWAMTQNNLGNALRALGERETGTARLEEAVVAFRLALEELKRKALPLDWAMAQNNLGNALRALGERETGTARLEEAVVAFRLALEEWTAEAAPYYHDLAQRNLKEALALIAEREGDN